MSISNELIVEQKVAFLQFCLVIFQLLEISRAAGRNRTLIDLLEIEWKLSMGTVRNNKIKRPGNSNRNPLKLIGLGIWKVLCDKIINGEIW